MTKNTLFFGICGYGRTSSKICLNSGKDGNIKNSRSRLENRDPIKGLLNEKFSFLSKSLRMKIINLDLVSMPEI